MFIVSNIVSIPVIQIIPATKIPAAESATRSPGTAIAKAMDNNDRIEEKASDR